MSRGPFRQRTIVILVVVCVISFLGLGLLAVFGPDFAPTRSGRANVYSSSAVGHGALHDVLRDMGVPVAIHRNPSRTPLQDTGVLLVLEPQLHLETDALDRPGLAQLIAEAPAVLLALPKWQVVTTDGKHPRVAQFAPWPQTEIMGSLEALGLDADLLRLQIEPEAVIEPNPYDLDPAYDGPFRQYLGSEMIEPVIGTANGMLLGRVMIDETLVYILSDPDLLQNHGLHREPNAQLVVTWIEELRKDGPVVFDETLHGFPPKNESLVRELFRFPLVLVLVHIVFVVVLLLWGGLARFGDAPPPPPDVEPGSEFLIRHTAQLLQFTKHRQMALRRYVGDTGRAVAARYRLPTDLKGDALDARLDALGARQGVTPSWSERKQHALAVAARADSGSGVAPLRAAHDLHAWKQEMLDGTGSSSRNT